MPKRLFELEDQLRATCGELRELEAKLQRVLAENLAVRRGARELEASADAVLESIENAWDAGVELDVDAMLENLQKIIQAKLDTP